MATTEDKLDEALNELARLTQLMYDIRNVIAVWEDKPEPRDAQEVLIAIGDKIRTWAKEG